VLERSTVFVEFEPQSRVEGDVQQMPADFPVVELWRVLAGQHPGRAAADEVTVFGSVGFALEDYAALGFVHDVAVDLGLGEWLELVPRAADPKDLFGLLRESPAEASTGRSGRREPIGARLDPALPVPQR
jgi:ornithine cyclodeaminase